MSALTPLGERIARLIAADGPMSVARYMALCLGDPQHGYYTTRDPFGAAGDFTTAPEISQMFGELIGLWSAAVWQQMGAPASVALVELGPGRGTLMADALRASAVVPGFSAALSVHLVETSPTLRDRQRATLAGTDVPFLWHPDIADVPAGPAIVLANEFFDALPVSQAVKTPTGWHERVVGLDAAGRLAFGLAPHSLSGFEGPRNAPNGAVVEWRSHAEIETIGRLVGAGGAALVIDYGHARAGFGDTLQAVRAHRFADPLETPGEVDLTAHVDFAALGRVASRAGLAVQGPVGQGAFLRRLGIEQRAAVLKLRASRPQAAAVDAALARLTGESAGQMGGLFKAMAFAPPRLGSLPGFDS